MENLLKKVSKAWLAIQRLSNIQILAELGRLPFKIYIETQMFKYLQRLHFLEENRYLRKAINEKLKITNSGLIANLKGILDSYGLYNLMTNIFKVVDGEISKKDYKNKHNCFQKRAKDCFIQENFFTYASRKMSIFLQTEEQYKKKTYLNFKKSYNKVAIIKPRLFSHNLAKWYKLPDDQKICRYCLRSNAENEIHVLFDCDNYITITRHIQKDKGS